MARRAYGDRMQLPRWSVLLLVAIVGCGDPAVVSGAPLTDAQVAAVLADATVDADDLPDAFEWETSEDQPAYLDACATTASELFAGASGAVSTSRSESYAGRRLGETGDLSDPSSVRVLGAVTAFDSDAAAAAAFALFDEDAFVGCLEDGIATDIEGFEDETAGAGDIDRVDVDAGPEDVGDESRLHSAYFPATVVAGFDDFEELDVIVTRVGPAVLTVAVLASAQNLSPDATGEFTLDVAGHVTDQVRAALEGTVGA